jgi:hypothetical protein
VSAAPQQQQQQSMPGLLNSLRAAVLNATAGRSNDGSAEQMRLLGMIDQLQSAWASNNSNQPPGAPSYQGGSPSTQLHTGGPFPGTHSGLYPAADHGATVGGNTGSQSASQNASGLYVLLEAVQQQAQLMAEGSAAAAAANAGSGRAAAAAAAAAGQGRYSSSSGYEAAAVGQGQGQGGMFYGDGGASGAAAAPMMWDDSQAVYGSGGYYDAFNHQQQQGGGGGGGGPSRRKRSWAAGDPYQQQQQAGSGGSGGLAAAVAAMMREEGMAVEDPASGVNEQKWLLKPRARGKRQVKLNKVALTGELPPVFDRWANTGKAQQGRGNAAAAAAAAAGAAGGSSDEDEAWRPPRSRTRPTKRMRTQGHGSEDGAFGSDASQGQQQQEGTGVAGAAAGAQQRRGYGWQLLQQGQNGGAAAPAGGLTTPAFDDPSGVNAASDDGMSGSGSDSGNDGGAAAGDSGSADAGSEGGALATAGSGSAATAAPTTANKPRAKSSGVRKERWVPPTEEWVTDDGIKVWPKVRRQAGLKGQGSGFRAGAVLLVRCSMSSPPGTLPHLLRTLDSSSHP